MPTGDVHLGTNLGGMIESDLSFADEMERASCHDQHNGANISELLRIANEADGHHGVVASAHSLDGPQSDKSALARGDRQ